MHNDIYGAQFSSINWNSIDVQYLEFEVCEKCWKIVSFAGIPGTEAVLRDIPGQNGIVGSYETRYYIYCRIRRILDCMSCL